MYKTISLERENGIAVLTLNRPENLNALSFKMIEDLQAAFDELDRNLKSRVLIMAGAGRGDDEKHENKQRPQYSRVWQAEVS